MSNLPNHMFIRNGIQLGVRFGGVHGPINPIGGTHPHLRIHFTGGLTADLDPMTATSLARQIPEALTALAALGGYPNCSGTVWGGDES